MNIQKSIYFECMFCRSKQFELPYKDYKPLDGEMIKCSNCGKLNDVISLKKVVEKNGKEFVEENAEKIIGEKLKKTFKKFNFKIF